MGIDPLKKITEIKNNSNKVTLRVIVIDTFNK